MQNAFNVKRRKIVPVENARKFFLLMAPIGSRIAETKLGNDLRPEGCSQVCSSERLNVLKNFTALVLESQPTVKP